jgi:hypothetical protein
VDVYVIEPRMRRWIHQDDRQPLLTRAFLLAQRIKEENQFTLPRDRAHGTKMESMETEAAPAL